MSKGQPPVSVDFGSHNTIDLRHGNTIRSERRRKGLPAKPPVTYGRNRLRLMTLYLDPVIVDQLEAVKAQTGQSIAHQIRTVLATHFKGE